MDPHIFPFDITVTEVTDFPDPEAGRVHEGDHGFGLEVRKGGDCLLYTSNLCPVLWHKCVHHLANLYV